MFVCMYFREDKILINLPRGIQLYILLAFRINEFLFVLILFGVSLIQKNSFINWID